MPTDLRKMTDGRMKALRGRVRECMNSLLTGPYAEVLEEGYRSLDELCSEIERLKAEAVVMRELCEADIGLAKAEMDHADYRCAEEDIVVASLKRSCALHAYRAMKEERNGSD